MKLKKTFPVLTFLLLLGAVVQAPFLLNPNVDLVRKMQVSDEYVLRERLSVESNTELIEEGYPGSGTEGDPYVIDGYEFPSVHFYKIDLHVIIQNCKFHYLTFHYSNNSVIRNCVAEIFISMFYCEDNIITGNNVTDGNIRIESSLNHSITDNTISSGGLFFYGEDVSYWTHTVGGNTLDGEPIEYMKDSENLVLDPDDYGPLILVNCQNCTIENGNVAESNRYILLGMSSNCTISNNENYHFTAQYSTNLTFNGNRASTRLRSGIDLLYCESVNVLNNSFWDNERDGIALQRSTDCHVEGNTVLGYTGLILYVHDSGLGCYQESGINIYQSDNCTVNNNTLAGNPRAGIWYSGNGHCNILNNTIRENTIVGLSCRGANSSIIANHIYDNGGFGIGLSTTGPYNITHNIIYNNSGGISASVNSYIATIANNTITDTVGCIGVQECQNSIIENNTMYGGGLSLYADNWGEIESENYHAKIATNIVNEKPVGFWWGYTSTSIDLSIFGQAIINNCSNVTFFDGYFEGLSTAVVVTSSNQTHISNTTVNECQRGISIAEGFNNTVSNCSASHCIISGMSVNYCTGGAVFNSSFLGASTGLYIGACLETTFDNNTISDAITGMRVYASENCSIRDNDFYKCGLDIFGYKSQHWNQEITGNRVNGRELGFFKDLSNTTINTTDYGAIIIANCDSMIFEGGNYANTSSGVLIYLSFNCTITGMTSRQNTESGFKIVACYNCTIDNCTGSDNEKFGIEVGNTASYTQGTRISHCRVENNTEGIRLTYDRYPAIFDSVVCHNDKEGILFYYASNVTIERCNITDNGLTGIAMPLGLGFNRISENNVSRNGAFGIYDGSGASIISNNTVAYNLGDGILFSSISTITRNIVLNNNRSGLTTSHGESANISWNWICNNSEYGIKFDCEYDQTYNHNISIIGNSLGWNTLGNALDNGLNNAWDDGHYIGNAWQDWSGVGIYSIPGLAGSVDNHPWQFGGDPPERPPITTTTSTSTTTSTTNTTTGTTEILYPIPLEIIVIVITLPLAVAVIIIIVRKRM